LVVQSEGLYAAREDVYELLAHAAQERIRDIIQDLVTISKHRQEALTAKTRVEILSNTKRQLLLMEKFDQTDKLDLDDDPDLDEYAKVGVPLLPNSFETTSSPVKWFMFPRD